MRKKWLEVLKIDHTSKWQHVCSDHFLKENYVPGLKKSLLYRNTIPQPYDQKCDQKCDHKCDQKCDQNGVPNK